MLFAFKLLSNFYIDEYKRLEYVLAWGGASCCCNIQAQSMTRRQNNNNILLGSKSNHRNGNKRFINAISILLYTYYYGSSRFVGNRR
jgi:hypothetical protein